MELGVVAESNGSNMVILSADGTRRFNDATMVMQNADVKNGAYTGTILPAGTPCVFDIINGEVIVFGAYLPPNLNPSPTPQGTNDQKGLPSKPEPVNAPYISRVPDDYPKNTNLPGDWSTSGPGGSEVALRGGMFSIKMTKAFFSVWNSLNSYWDTMCDKFSFRSPAADVFVDVNEAQETNVTISVRKGVAERKTGAIPAMELKLGKEANIIKMKINGKDFLEVDGERNVMMHVKNFEVKAEEFVTLPK